MENFDLIIAGLPQSFAPRNDNLYRFVIASPTGEAIQSSLTDYINLAYRAAGFAELVIQNANGFYKRIKRQVGLDVFRDIFFQELNIV